jgi:peptide deformylase
MQFLIENVPENTKKSLVLPYTKIKIKSVPWNESKGTSYAEAKELIYKMMKVCLEDDGIGLSAPQLGIYKQLFIIRDLDESNTPKNSFTAYYNPTWTAVQEDGKETDVEGCLSVPHATIEVDRWKTINLSWLSLQEDGSFKKESAIFTGYMARIVQHESAHLRARSIVDDGKSISELNGNRQDKKFTLDNKQRSANTKAKGNSQGARPKYS